MPSNEFRQLLQKIADHQRPVKRLRYRESLGTHIVGALSLSLGLAALLRIAYIWHGAADISLSFSVWLYPPPESQMPVIPSSDPAFERYYGIATVGQFLGVAGVWRSKRMKGTLSLLSVIGTATCVAALSPVYLVIVFWAMVLGWPFMLAIAVLAFVVILAKLAVRP